MQTFLISYDISNNRLRLKVAKWLLKAGLYRIQYSVFMGTPGHSALKKLKKELNQLTTDKDWSKEDSIFLLPLHQYTKNELEIIGKTATEWPLIYRELHTLVI